jgi:site-specific DNA-methyltransferase (adenine-specific)
MNDISNYWKNLGVPMPSEKKERVLTQFELPKDFFNKEDLLNLSILGDIFVALSKIPDNTLDVIVCDPPYNISYRRKFVRKGIQDINMSYGRWDYMSFDDYLRFLYALVEEFHRVLKESGTLYLFLPDRVLSFVMKYCEDKLNMFIKTTYVWVKPNPPPRFDTNSFAHATEYTLVAQKNKEKAIFHFYYLNDMHNNSSIPIVSGNERLKSRVFDKEKEKYKTLHPTQKPIALISKYIQFSSNEFDLIGDFMAGTFTTGICAKMLNRYYIIIEKSSRYFRYGIERLQKTKLSQEFKLRVRHKKKKEQKTETLDKFFKENEK